MRDALANVLEERDTFLGACAEVEAVLGEQRSASSTVARMLEPWLATQAA